MFVIKRSKALEAFNPQKIENLLLKISEGLSINFKQILDQSLNHIQDNMSTEDILVTLTKIISDLTSKQQTDNQYLAGRLLIIHLRKACYGTITPPSFFQHVSRLVKLGWYEPDFLTCYSKEELDFLDSHIHHDRDFNLTHAAVTQFMGKYLLCDRVNKIYYETPQMLYMALACSGFKHYPKSTRSKYVVDFYNLVSEHKISLPTPILSSLRTGFYGVSSCVVIESDDSIDSMSKSAGIAMKYISHRSGIGLNVGRIRPIGSPIKKGLTPHSGIVPFIQFFQSTIKSCSQTGVRNGSATLFCPIWHLEIRTILQLKNNRGSSENRARHVDYGIQINELFYQRLIANQDITILDHTQVPGLYDAFFRDQQLFQELYTAAEANSKISKEVLPAKELFASLALERAQTGRIYIQNVDTCNIRSSFNAKAPAITSSNLCMEITLPTTPVNNEDSYEIALCTLSAVNVGVLNNLEELKSITKLMVRFLDAVLEHQNYPFKRVAETAKRRRSLGIGITNFAYFLAKHGYRYGDIQARNLTHQLFETLQYYLLEASCELAKEQGPCRGFSETKYSDGILPIDNHKPYVDTLHSQDLILDWTELRAKIAKYGLRNSTLSAQMPCEASSVIINSTNGIEAPRGIMSVKSSKHGNVVQILPTLEDKGTGYQLLWDLKNEDNLILAGIMQKFIDQSISTNINYDPSQHPNNLVPVRDILRDLLFAYKLGLKTLYYHNTRELNANSEFLSKKQDSEGCDCAL